ncbi:N-formylglutamate amidohydrolase [Defluviimonas sp. WL0024]|uniref:N-formylglutamate amidohydrolase n=2 Tax=Albidovulum TaxID=205889 RepID=A0ABT3JA58_9RHOB|nr:MULTISPECIES: N-formylglutamate amidohydrolase [Defluviimonas]MCU9848252.1 N-formylglutamate amidohydrolase [Defluviimonas sp. WL0024]MCW3784560.1 N-formylglutamate amidohydrolase [Defluviimonas salinarum]
MTDHPFEIVGEDRPSRWLVTCDHATNRVPPCIGGGDLGIAAEDMERHIAYDIGAAGVTRRLAERLGAPAILSDFSRLVIDPNRGEDDPTLVMKLYDGTVIPANRAVDAAETERRLNAFHRPYHAALETLAARRADAVICAVHSFTPRLFGRGDRPWQVGILYSHLDPKLSLAVLERLRAEPDLNVGENEPYGGHLDGDSIDRHALKTGRANVLIEIRHDLIRHQDGQIAWADRLAPILEAALADTDL